MLRWLGYRSVVLATEYYFTVYWLLLLCPQLRSGPAPGDYGRTARYGGYAMLGNDWVLSRDHGLD